MLYTIPGYDAWKLDCPPDDVCEGCERITDLCECAHCETCDAWLPALDDAPHVCLCEGCGSESDYCECECEVCGDALGITYIPDRMPRCADHMGGE